MNWEQENALLYAGRYEYPELASVRLSRCSPTFLISCVTTSGSVGTSC